MTTALEPSEHVNAARNLHSEATAAFAAGRNLIGAELLWGAVAHSLIAAAQQRGMHHEHHRDFRRAAWQVKEETGHADIWIGFKGAEQLHIYFYHQRMFGDYNLTTARRDANHCFGLLLALFA